MKPGARGVSLVSLLVAMALSLICLVTALQAYRAVVLGSRGTGTAARVTGTASALEIQLARLLPAAGWGIGGGSATPGGTLNQHLVLLANATLSGSNSLSGSTQTLSATAHAGNAIVWATAIDGSLACSALISRAAQGLQLLGPKPCSTAQSALNSNWDEVVTLVPQGVFPDLGFTVGTAQCWPYGGPLKRASASVQLSGVRATLPAVCLPNIRG
ncbi:hypothetical protein [Rubrivivax gelatinosus]|uniref:Uncharacterized protein n=1 Tax=Rubrivivax gelatinosus (strain NBRC 100245 / IL144) TaxID=983917 RepID=I0HVT0_RUBGI|nr:hypothetical protein [Rubrivivax gelatinosus]BAL97117.1 hypothetical protein RGE_37780 [Rubrivivax gelatinosus IL144]